LPLRLTDDCAARLRLSENSNSIRTSRDRLPIAEGSQVAPSGAGTVGNGCGLELGWYLDHGDSFELQVDKIGVLKDRVERQGI